MSGFLESMLDSVSGPENKGKRIALIFVAVVGGLATLLVGASVFPTASNQGYYPEQPIPFSHKLHAGTLKIDCRYCHVNTERSPNASIPALNVCMNCHTTVRTESKWIQQIKDHYDKGKPIEWVRIHELPDFVRFDHRPHVKAGLQCETCHGDIKTMDRVHQDKDLTMGWCINCHRGNTTPKDILKKFHPEAADPTGMQVAPQNCTTCHY